MSIIYSSELKDLAEYNSSFDVGVLRICYTGLNRNNSFISKDTFERCIKSIYNCPIVCRYDREIDEIGEHDVELVTRDDGSMKLVNITHPVGVIPSEARYWWGEVEEEDGTIHEYLYTDALLWKRQEAYEKIRRDGVTGESMEICVKEGRMVDGVYVIDRFEFTAFCLLGLAKPCFESASLITFTADEFKRQLDDMMQDFKACFTKQDVEISNDNLEGGEAKLDNKDFALVGQIITELIDALGVETVETEWGGMSRYWYMDFDNEKMEVYCTDSADWKMYGFAYSMTGDSVVIDFESKKRVRYSIVDFDEGVDTDQPVSFAKMYESFAVRYTENDSFWNEKYQAATENASTIESELNELREFKANTEKADREAAVNTVFSQFEDLAGIEDFEALRDNCDQLSADDLTEKCFAIRGKTMASKFAVREQKAPKLVVERDNESKDDEPYGGVFTEYGIKRKQ